MIISASSLSKHDCSWRIGFDTSSGPSIQPQPSPRTYPSPGALGLRERQFGSLLEVMHDLFKVNELCNVERLLDQTNQHSSTPPSNAWQSILLLKFQVLLCSNEEYGGVWIFRHSSETQCPADQ